MASNRRRTMPPYRPQRREPETVYVPSPCEPCSPPCPAPCPSPKSEPKPKPEPKASGSDFFGGILEKIQSLLGKFLGRPAGWDDLLLIGILVVLFLDKKEGQEDEDRLLLMVVLLYLLL